MHRVIAANTAIIGYHVIVIINAVDVGARNGSTIIATEPRTEPRSQCKAALLHPA
jgi:hypothetical protein